MSNTASRPIVLALVLIASLSGLALTSTAQAASDCSGVFLPALKCDGYQARPEGAFNPVGMPYLFEDPYITTGLNFAYIYHRLPDSGALGVAFDGGGAHVLALQIRVALTDRLGFIATKDGLVMLRPGSASVVDEDTGIFDMTIGFKYKLLESKEYDFILTPALRYEIPMGNEGLFQGYGSGVLIPSASFRWGLGKLGLEGANLVGGLGGQLPIHSTRNATSLFYNIHLDYGFKLDGKLVKYIAPFIELNGTHYTRSGAGGNLLHLRTGGKIPLRAAQSAAVGLGTGPFEGVDIANLGSPGIKGKDVVVLGGGIRMPTTLGISFALMYEGPVSSRKDIHNGRFTFMATWEL